VVGAGARKRPEREARSTNGKTGKGSRLPTVAAAMNEDPWIPHKRSSEGRQQTPKTDGPSETLTYCTVHVLLVRRAGVALGQRVSIRARLTLSLS